MRKRAAVCLAFCLMLSLCLACDCVTVSSACLFLSSQRHSALTLGPLRIQLPLPGMLAMPNPAFYCRMTPAQLADSAKCCSLALLNCAQLVAQVKPLKCQVPHTAQDIE